MRLRNRPRNKGKGETMPKLIPVEHRTYSVFYPLMEYNRDEPVREAYKRVCSVALQALQKLAPRTTRHENEYHARIDDCVLELETTSDWCLRDPWEEGSASLDLEIVGPRGKTWRVARDIGVPKWKEITGKEVIRRCERASLYDAELKNMTLQGLVHKLYELKTYGKAYVRAKK